MIFSAIFGKKDHGSVVVASVFSMLSCHRVYAKLTVYVCRCIFGPYVHTEHSGLKFTKFFIHNFSRFWMDCFWLALVTVLGILRQMYKCRAVDQFIIQFLSILGVLLSEGYYIELATIQFLFFLRLLLIKTYY